jgi:Ubiquitin family
MSQEVLFKTLTGRSIVLEVERSAPFSVHKKELAALLECDPSLLTLVFGGRPLVDDESLEDTNYQSMGVSGAIHVVVRLQAPPMVKSAAKS